MAAESYMSDGGDLSLTMVELALAEELSPSGRPDAADIVDVAVASGFRDEAHDWGVAAAELFELDIASAAAASPVVPGIYELENTPPTVTHSMPGYVTANHVAPPVLPAFVQQTTSLPPRFDLISQTDTSLLSSDPLSGFESSGDRLLFDCVMPYPEVAVADTMLEVGRRKKAVPRRRTQSTGVKRASPMGNTALEKPGADDDFARLVDYVPECLERYGFCVVDKFAGKQLALSVRSEVLAMYDRGSFEDGLLTTQAFAVTEVRGDRVFWLEREDDEHCTAISQLICRLDDLFLRLRGCLGSCHISSRSKAMLACYPGQGRCYRRHVDNPNQDGRAVTAIYYVNKSWNSPTDGGVLRMYPSQLPNRSVDVEPMFDRIVFFWSDGRTPHEVQPAYRDRYAVTVWYFNDVERQQARQRYAVQGNQVDSSARFASVALSTVA